MKVRALESGASPGLRRGRSDREGLRRITLLLPSARRAER
jgi:hypothetical protein